MSEEKKEEENYEFIDLVMDNGELVRIGCPEKYMDKLFETLDHCMKRRDFWNPNQFDGCYALYFGHSLDRVNMGKVTGQI